jgi:hypothetical protein
MFYFSLRNCPWIIKPTVPETSCPAQLALDLCSAEEELSEYVVSGCHDANTYVANCRVVAVLQPSTLQQTKD